MKDEELKETLSHCNPVDIFQGDPCPLHGLGHNGDAGFDMSSRSQFRNNPSVLLMKSDL